MPSPDSRSHPRLHSSADTRRQAQLEALSDLLLATAEATADDAPPPSLEYPYSGYWRLDQLDAYSRRVVAPPPPDRQAGEDRWCLVWRALDRLPLSRRQRLAFRLTARGLTPPQVGALLGTTADCVRALNYQTRRRLQRALEEQREAFLPPRAALREVYCEEVNRRGYQPETHCPAGQEECRRTGQCPRRWYLYFVEDTPDLAA
jgi:DNA-directed RNA polymerase specialized sigma24 family protein